MNDLISRQALCEYALNQKDKCVTPNDIMRFPSAQPEIIKCKDCEYGKQDEVGRWFCGDLGCQIGNEDGSGYCSDAERRADA